jgi:hypothetical protein
VCSKPANAHDQVAASQHLQVEPLHTCRERAFVRASRRARVCACVVGMLVSGQRGIGEDSPTLLASRCLHALEVVLPEEGASKQSAHSTQRMRNWPRAQGAASATKHAQKQCMDFFGRCRARQCKRKHASVQCRHKRRRITLSCRDIKSNSPSPRRAPRRRRRRKGRAQRVDLDGPRQVKALELACAAAHR